MRERPILFSAPMVRALLDGRKTQTRRVVKGVKPEIAKAMDLNRGLPLVLDENGYGGLLAEGPGLVFGIPLPRCPYGVPGDRLWVRETWGLWDTAPSDGPERATVFYRASDEHRHELRHQLWRPSIHMPRWASRLTLTLTDVRVERVQDISCADAVAEGVVPTLLDLKHPLREAAFARGKHHFLSAAEAEKYDLEEGDCHPDGPFAGAIEFYAALWDSLNAARGYGWDVNPWVWVLTFSVADCAAAGRVAA